ncbi:MAG: AAA family ATPase [Candidatus Adiutrix sp.]|jgi:chromosome partitioning protein|nr:AAA family ATPase [Candidatus Adiutrix sp.]
MAGGTHATKVISILNLKGGVAKTTLTVALADALVNRGQKVLVVDLDPQCDTSVMLVGHERWKEMADAGQTLKTFFASVPKLKSMSFPLGAIRKDGVSNIKSTSGRLINTMSLLASDTALADIQDGAMPAGFSYEALKHLLAPLRAAHEFSHILIDCPPNFGLFTRNALHASDSYIIPAIPDYLSMLLGVQRTFDKVKNHFIVDHKGCPKLLGIVTTKYQADVPLFVTILEEMHKRETLSKYLKEPALPQTANLAQAAMYTSNAVTFINKYPQPLASSLNALVDNLGLLQ